jgi:5-methylcytosine-specific restriction protein B
MRNAFGTSPDSVQLGKSTDDRIEYFEHPSRNNAPGATMQQSAPEPVLREDSLTSVTQALRQFRQIILYGPPGTGKTRLARRAALALLENRDLVVPRSEDEEASVSERLSALRKQGVFDLVVFHPAYEYEQFVGGITPQPSGDKLSYKIEPGIFLEMARRVEKDKRPAVLMIDEINRGNLPKLLGELLYALEYRNVEVRLPFNWEGSHLVVPKNFYIVGTMNSSDRSIGHIDVAVRRRFGLLHVKPDAQIVRDCWQDTDPALGDQLASLMVRLNKALEGEDRGGELLVGHAYFLADRSLPDPRNQVKQKWAHQVQQLLREYGQLLTLEDSFFTKFPESLDDALLTN